MEQIGSILSRLKDTSITANSPTENKAACPLCNGMEYVEVDPSDGNGSFMRCECLKKKIQKEQFKVLFEKANMKGMEHMTLSSFRPVTPLQSEALKLINEGHNSFYLYGQWGVGKTHLMAGTVLRAIKQSIPSVIISVPKLLDEIRRAGREGNAQGIEQLAHDIPYLCLDDIGKEKGTDWTEERLYLLIDHRWQASQKGGSRTSFTSQLPLNLLAKKIDGAICSRIKGMCSGRILKLDGEDYRSNSTKKED